MVKFSTAVLSLAYLGPVQYFSKILAFKKIFIEQCDSYCKQTYRNRCIIFGANGPQVLAIPVQKGLQHKTLVKDIRIDYSENWQKMHWKSIESAYRSAAFYEYFHEELNPFYRKKVDFLLDYVREQQTLLLKILDLFPDIVYTNEYRKDYTDEILDYRELIHPKKKLHDPMFRPYKYFQVFADKHGFQPNLSIIDLLFNTGPEARKIIAGCLIPKG